MALKIISINANGLRNETKRRAIFNYARQRADIVCIQETHSDTQNELCWTLQWGGPIYFSHGNTNARGVAILISKKCDVTHKLLEKDISGRRLTVQLEYQEQKFAISNIYAPNNDDPDFFIETFEQTFAHTEKPIYIGDFNVVLDPKVDRQGERCNNDKACEVLHHYSSELLLQDIWRSRNQGVKRYSFFRKKPRPTSSGIDYALVPIGMDSAISSCFYVPCTQTDHSALFLSIAFNSDERGTGYWKFKDSLLDCPSFVEGMNTMLESKMEKYSTMTAIDQFEIIKFECTVFTQNWSRDIAEQRRFVSNQLYDKLNELQEQLSEHYDERKYDLMCRTQQDIDEIEYEKAKSILFRCHAKWQIEAERNTSYFFSLEKAKYNAKTCSSLVDRSGKVIRNSKKILQIQKDFYRTLYTKDHNVHFKAPNIKAPKITERDQSRLEEQLSIEEFDEALKSMPTGKTPGSDGLTVAFYKRFYPKLRTLLYTAIIQGLNENKLHKSARRGIINLIPKSGRDTRILKNLRPISLLNISFKILGKKAIANRIDSVIDQLIHFHQKGFLKGRRISSNIRKVLDIVRECHKSGSEGEIVQIDFQKCFDKIEMSAITGSFGPQFINTIRTTYKDFSACVQNNGHFSEPFNITHGVRQGAPNSSFIFLLCAEIMAIMI